jgi:tetratricopeptide (TPR) repeat protein
MMKKVAFGYVCAVLVVLAAGPAAAQLKLPAASPAAKVVQDVGLTTISVEYSSPGVKGRKIWGELVPWDKPWRTGADAATKITFSRDVTFGGKPVPAGTYSIVTLPTQKGWTMMLSKELGLWQGETYDPKEDVLSVPATTAAIPHRERLAFLFSNTTDSETSLDMEWEKLRVSVPIKADTAAQAQANIKAEMDNAWRMPSRAARYELDTTKNYDAALKYAEMSIAIQPTWYNNWTKAEALAKKGNYAEARKFAQVAWDMGEKEGPGFFFKDAVSKALTEWKDKK